MKIFCAACGNEVSKKESDIHNEQYKCKNCLDSNSNYWKNKAVKNEKEKALLQKTLEEYSRKLDETNNILEILIKTIKSHTEVFVDKIPEEDFAEILDAVTMAEKSYRGNIISKLVKLSIETEYFPVVYPASYSKK